MGLQVLIVDDSAVMRSVLKKVVSLSGYDVSRFFDAGNGQEALDVLSREWIDLILLDVHMPVMDGLALLRRMQGSELFKTIPTVMVTTEASQEAIQEALQLGARAHVRKPFQPETIRKILETILGDEYERKDAPDVGGCDF
jgi:two-component system chemotaxis response regulator CheY